MKKEIVEYLGFEDDSKNPVGRPKLADKKTKKKSLIIAGISFTFVILLLIFGYGTLFGFRNLNLKGAIAQNNISQNVLVDEISPLVKDITLKVGTARKAYLTVLPANATNKDIIYESSDKNVAIVDAGIEVGPFIVGHVVGRFVVVHGQFHPGGHVGAVVQLVAAVVVYHNVAFERLRPFDGRL